jgi:polysaccharide export outer membrane protein
MQGAFDTAALSKVEIPEIRIQKNDLLNIVVYSDNPTATAIYNQTQIGGSPSGSAQGSQTANSGVGASMSTGGTNPSTGGYLVGADGNIQFQDLGAIHVEGLTKAQLKDTLDLRLKKYLQNPYTTVRFLNYKITVIGDVARPSVYTIPSEKVNLLEALGLAGDLDVTARRDNVLIIREEDGVRSFGRIDLTKPDIFKSPFFQLKQNDVIYVDLTKNKAVTGDQFTIRNIAIMTSVVTTVALIVTIFKN